MGGGRGGGEGGGEGGGDGGGEGGGGEGGRSISPGIVLPAPVCGGELLELCVCEFQVLHRHLHTHCTAVWVLQVSRPAPTRADTGPTTAAVAAVASTDTSAALTTASPASDTSAISATTFTSTFPTTALTSSIAAALTAALTSSPAAPCRDSIAPHKVGGRSTAAGWAVTHNREAGRQGRELGWAWWGGRRHGRRRWRCGRRQGRR